MGRFKRKNGNSKEIIKKRRNGVVSIKEKIFIEEYLQDFNATRAYLKAYPKCMYDTAKTGGCDNLTNPNIMSEIDKRITDMFSRLEIRNEDLIAEYAKQAFIDTRSFYVDNAFVGMNRLNIAQQSCIESLDIEEMYETNKEGKKEYVGRKTKVKFYSRKGAMDSLMKYKGLIKDVTNNINIDNRTVELIASKELEDKLGANKVIEFNKLLSGERAG